MSKTLKVDKNLCIACGMCAAVAPNIYEEDDLGYASVIKNYCYHVNDKQVIAYTIKNCPARAISFKNNKETNF